MKQCIGCQKCDVGCVVRVDGKPVPPVNKFSNHMGLGCGHEATNMAYGILYMLKGEDIARRYCLSFKFVFISYWEYDKKYEIDVDEWLANKVW